MVGAGARVALTGTCILAPSEGKLCHCYKEDVEVVEVEDDDDLTSELSYETVYHTPVAITGLLEDIPNRLVPIGDLVITPGGFREEVRDMDEDSN